MSSSFTKLISFKGTRSDLLIGILFVVLTILSFIFTLILDVSLLVSNLIGSNLQFDTTLLSVDIVFLLIKFFTAYKFSSWNINFIVLLVVLEGLSSLLLFNSETNININPLPFNVISILANVLLVVSLL